jgi:hypothetical protein
MANFQYKSGLGHAAAYQVSGKPFVTGGLTASARGTTPTEVEFPAVTKEITFSDWVTWDPAGPGALPGVIRVGFSANGVNGTNYISLSNTSTPVTLDVKARSVFIVGEGSDGTALSATGSIYASLTSIETGSIPSNWTGSVGVG